MLKDGQGHAIIIRMTAKRLNGDSVSDKTISWNGKGASTNGNTYLGVYCTDWFPKNGDVCVGFRLRGWGFGWFHNKDSMGQGYSWQGAVIPRTVFEISVINRELTPAELKLLLSGENTPSPVDKPAADKKQ